MSVAGGGRGGRGGREGVGEVANFTGSQPSSLASIMVKKHICSERIEASTSSTTHYGDNQ